MEPEPLPGAPNFLKSFAHGTTLYVSIRERIVEEGTDTRSSSTCYGRSGAR